MSAEIILKLNPEPEKPRSSCARRFGLFPHNGGPVYKQYATVKQRLKTYSKWPKNSPLAPEQLASAGFFYAGVDDKTVCFYCRGGLIEWEEGDEAWEQHALQFPGCSFVAIQKGEHFIDEVGFRLGKKFPNRAGTATLEDPIDLRMNLPVEEGSATTINLTIEDEDSDFKMCKICYTHEVAMAFTPCGHIVTCVDCTSAFSSCPFCKKPILATLRVFSL